MITGYSIGRKLNQEGQRQIAGFALPRWPTNKRRIHSIHWDPLRWQRFRRWLATSSDIRQHELPARHGWRNSLFGFRYVDGGTGLTTVRPSEFTWSISAFRHRHPLIIIHGVKPAASWLVITSR